jgi:hypothetical protein
MTTVFLAELRMPTVNKTNTTTPDHYTCDTFVLYRIYECVMRLGRTNLNTRSKQSTSKNLETADIARLV